MTWDEFKAYVDAEIKSQGKDGHIKVWCIDISYPDLQYKSSTPFVSTANKNGMMIS